MAAGPILTLGLGSFGSVNLLPTLGYGIAIVSPPSVSGIEFTAPFDRLEFTIDSSWLLDFTSPSEQLDYTQGEP